MADLKLVFRQPSDIGLVRLLSTPDASVINTNLENFVKKWDVAMYIWTMENNYREHKKRSIFLEKTYI